MTALILSLVAILTIMALGMPIALALGATGIFWIILIDPRLLTGVAYALWNTSSGDVLISVPLFILMGTIIELSQVAERFYRASHRWVRKLPGGLLHSNILGCGVFSAVCGSAVATAATIGSAAVPSMVKHGYDKKLTCGSLAAGGTLGILIPPSIPLLIYASLTDVSPGRLFMGTIVPGLLVWLMFHVYIIGRASLGPVMTSSVTVQSFENASWSRSLFDVIPLVLLVVVIVFLIYSGWTTTVEIAGVGTALAVIVSVAAGTFSFGLFRRATLKTVRLTAALMFIVAGAQAYSVALFSSGLSFALVDSVKESGLGPYTILLIIMGLYLVLGTFIDELSMMLMSITLVHPVVVSLGFDPVWFAALLVIALQIGLLSPPVGMTIFAIKLIAPSDVTLSEITWGTVPFTAILLLALVMLIAFPGLVLWLPSSMN